MEPLYPQNILERRYPILREQREKAERDAVDEKYRPSDGVSQLFDELEGELYVNTPSEDGEAVGHNLNTFA